MVAAELILRPQQAELIQQVRLAFEYKEFGGEEHDQVLLQAPTGFGKTTMFTYMANSARLNGARTHVFAHLNELLDQICERFDKYDVPYGVLQNGKHLRPWEPIQVCSIQTYQGRLDQLERPDLIVFDEAHHCVANTYQKVVKWAKGAQVLGVTATPERLDGKGFDQAGYTKLIKGPSLKSLIENGHLVPIKMYSRPGTLLKGSSDTDYSTAKAEEISEAADVFGCSVAEYQRVAMGTLAVAFYASVKHAKKGADAFNAAGIPAAVIYGDMPKAERKMLFEKFQRREILVLCNCNLIAEGVDVPGIETVIIAKPSKSIIFYLQSIGRALRPAPGKQFAILLDQVGLYEYFKARPEADRDWSLIGRSKLTDFEKHKQCKLCGIWVKQTASKCSECGASFAAGGGAGGREITTAEGQLILVQDDVPIQPVIPKTVLIQQAFAGKRTLEQCIATARELGYSDNYGRRQYNIKRRGKGTSKK